MEKSILVNGDFSNIKINTVIDLRLLRYWRFKMINRIFQLMKPGFIQLNMLMRAFRDKVIVKPLYVSLYMLIRYYLERERSKGIAKNWITMAPIHESVRGCF